MSTSNKKQHFLFGVALALITVIIWSGNYVVARGVSKQIPPISLAFYRWATASICIIPFAYKKVIAEKQIIIQHKNYLFWVSLTGVAIFNTFIYLAGHYTTAINLALIGTTAAPIFATILAAIFLKEIISLYRIAGMVLCIVSILFLLSKGSLQNLINFHFSKGDALMFFSAFSFAIYNTLVRKKPTNLSPISFLMVTFIVGTLLLLPFYLNELSYSQPIVWNSNLIATILYIGIGNSVIGFLCWNAAIGKIGASATILFANLIPIFSTIEAVLILGEQFSNVHLIAGVLVITGLVIANFQKKKKQVISI